MSQTYQRGLGNDIEMEDYHKGGDLLTEVDSHDQPVSLSYLIFF